MNYSDPKLQRLTLQQASAQPWGGVANRAAWYSQYLKEAEQTKLALQEVGLRSQMQKAHIEQMKFDQEMKGKELGLLSGWLDLKGRTMQWEHKFADKKLSDAERNLDVSTILGLGTAGLAAYEGYRRKKKTEELTSSYKSWIDALGRNK